MIYKKKNMSLRRSSRQRKVIAYNEDNYNISSDSSSSSEREDLSVLRTFIDKNLERHDVRYTNKSDLRGKEAVLPNMEDVNELSVYCLEGLYLAEQVTTKLISKKHDIKYSIPIDINQFKTPENNTILSSNNMHKNRISSIKKLYLANSTSAILVTCMIKNEKIILPMFWNNKNKGYYIKYESNDLYLFFKANENQLQYTKFYKSDYSKMVLNIGIANTVLYVERIPKCIHHINEIKDHIELNKFHQLLQNPIEETIILSSPKKNENSMGTNNDDVMDISK